MGALTVLLIPIQTICQIVNKVLGYGERYWFGTGPLCRLCSVTALRVHPNSLKGLPLLLVSSPCLPSSIYTELKTQALSKYCRWKKGDEEIRRGSYFTVFTCPQTLLITHPLRPPPPHPPTPLPPTWIVTTGTVGVFGTSTWCYAVNGVCEEFWWFSPLFMVLKLFNYLHKTSHNISYT